MLKTKFLATLCAVCLLATPALAQDSTDVVYSNTYLGVNAGALLEDGDTTNALTGTALYEFSEGLVLEYELGVSDLNGEDESQDYTKIGWRVATLEDENNTRVVLGLQRNDLYDKPLYGIFGGVMRDLGTGLMYRALIDVTDSELDGVEVGARVGFFVLALSN